MITGFFSLLLALVKGTTIFDPHSEPFMAALALLASAVAFGAVFLGSQWKNPN
jgi:hypothetical protein